MCVWCKCLILPNSDILAPWLQLTLKSCVFTSEYTSYITCASNPNYLWTEQGFDCGLCGQNIFGISKKKERNIIALPFPSVNFMFVPDFCFAFLPVAERKTNSFRETGLLVRVESAWSLAGSYAHKMRMKNRSIRWLNHPVNQSKYLQSGCLFALIC